MGDSKIQWTEKTWNPVRGCREVSPGCANCYAARQAFRFAGPGRPYEGLAAKRPNGKVVWTGEFREAPEKLHEPLGWQGERMIFVNSMSDLFGEGVGDEFIASVFAVMAARSRHTFQVLTKRADRMRRLLSDQGFREEVACEAERLPTTYSVPDRLGARIRDGHWPLPNVWLGVSVEDQKRADERLPLLEKTPAAVRMVSAEPLLGAVNFLPYIGAWCPRCGWQETEPGQVDRSRATSGSSQAPCRRCGGMLSLSHRGIHWAILGGESGPGARRCDADWIRAAVRQCKAAGVAVFVKQLGSNATWVEECWLSPGSIPSAALDAHLAMGGSEPDDVVRRLGLSDPKGGDPAEWPEDLRIREYPCSRS